VAARPFKILGVQQIAIGSADKTRLRRLWVDLLGLDPIGQHRSEAENTEEDRLRAGSGIDSVEIDLMQPIDPQRKPRVDQPALHHIGLWVDDLRAAKAWLEERGVRFTPGGIRQGAGGHEVCFIHPRGNDEAPLGGEGVLIEMVQAPRELIERAARKGGGGD
jgi:lactoylglutathione lyase